MNVAPGLHNHEGAAVDAVAPSSLAAVSLRNLTKRYGSVVAVSSLDLDIRAGEFVTLLGASGSGKTTTLHMIAGFEQPDSGEIFLHGRSMHGVPPHRRKIGVVFQNYALFPHLNVAENIGFGLRNMRWPRDKRQERVRELLELVGLAEFGCRRPHQLSGGQQQRVAIARALSFNPEVLLLDEPLGALDRALREVMLSELRRLHRILNVTMIYVTHDQEEALAMSDRVAMMERGKLVALGTPQQLYEEPTGASVAAFLGDTNLIECDVLAPDAIAVDGQMLRVNTRLAGREKVALSVRPEKILLADAPESWFTSTARIIEVVYLGESTRYRIASSGGRELWVKAINGPGVDRYELGESVTFSWDPNDAVVVGGEAGR